LVECKFKTGFYKIETSYFATENRTFDADYAVYVNTTTTAATNKTAKPVFATVINQIGNDVTWKTLGTYCLKKNDISMIVLDNNDDSGSASTDAGRGRIWVRSIVQKFVVVSLKSFL